VWVIQAPSRIAGKMSKMWAEIFQKGRLSKGVFNMLARQLKNMNFVLFVALFLVLLSTPAHSATRLRIMTFNVQWLTFTPRDTNKDPWGPEYTLNEHFERVAGVIEALQPDVVNLVEVTSKKALDKLVKILHQKGLTQYRSYHIQSNDTKTGQNIAYLTKRIPDSPAGYSINKFYSSSSSGKWRESYSWTMAIGQVKNGTTSISKQAVYYFSVGGKKLGFLGLHLVDFPDHVQRNAQREAQSMVAQKIIREKIVNLGYLPVVLGVLNNYDGDVGDRDDRVGTKTKVLSNLKNYDPSTPGNEMFNAAKKITRKFDRYTVHWDKDEDGVPDEKEPMTMIDHILIHKSLEPFVKRVFIDHGHGSQTSDHWPVVVDLEWN
jgi:endonuclease/exonuclease/phosphatase family metal-dependent hydrolase